MSDSPSTTTRRHALAGAAAALAGATAGCANLRSDGIDDEEPPGDDGPRTATFERLEEVAVYVADAATLAAPAALETVDAPANADLLVLPDDTAVAADAAVEWLADDRAVALLGPEAQATWLDWVRSDAYRDVFGEGGAAAADPAPQLVVGAAVGSDATTYRRTWGEEPSDREVLRALDEVLLDLAERTPR